MRNKIIDALKYPFSTKDKVVFDANVLVSLFSGLEPPGSTPMRKYSRVLKEIKEAGAQMLLDVLVMSEFINVCVRKNYSLATAQGGAWESLKRFRQSALFPPIASDIARTARQIVALCTPIDHPFSQWGITDLLDEYAIGQSDFNDQLIVELCRRESALLLTDDTDFTQGGITVLTTHPKLLASCP
jgi:predicted nucleic acid-binding protein